MTLSDLHGNLWLKSPAILLPLLLLRAALVYNVIFHERNLGLGGLCDATVGKTTTHKGSLVDLLFHCVLFYVYVMLLGRLMVWLLV